MLNILQPTTKNLSIRELHIGITSGIYVYKLGNNVLSRLGARDMVIPSCQTNNPTHNVIARDELRA